METCMLSIIGNIYLCIYYISALFLLKFAKVLIKSFLSLEEFVKCFML